MTVFILDTLGSLTVITSILVITASSPVVAVMYLITVFILAACYLICLGVTFVGLSYLIVYVGAVAVLFLFVVMILNVRLAEVVSVGHEYNKGVPLGIIIGVIFLYELISVVPVISAGEIALGYLSNIHMNLLGLQSSINSINDVHIAFQVPSADAMYSSMTQVQSLGLCLYTYGSLWLLLTSIILLLAMIGPIALCLRSR